LNKNRVPHIAKYIVDNEDGYLFASITASYKCPVDFKPSKDSPSLGMLQMDFEQANFVINDGQHRCAAIAQALKENPSLEDEAISVLLFPYESLARVQQMFSDLNRFVAKTSRSLDILYDKRDPLSRVLLEACDKVPVFRNVVEKDAMSLPAKSDKLFTLTALYDATNELLSYRGTEERFHTETVEEVVDFWTTIAGLIPEWAAVKNGDLKSITLRQEKICAHSVVLRALGAIGSELKKEDPEGWKSKLTGLTQVNWRKDNHDWENVCIVANSVVSNRQARVATRAYLKAHLGLPLSDVEKKAVVVNNLGGAVTA
jgi:DNA sulfur modification protein DndB